MFGWIDRAWQWAAGSIGGSVVNWVRDLIHGVWGFVHAIFGNVVSGWDDVVTWSLVLMHQSGYWLTHLDLLLTYLFRDWIPHIIKWAEREIYRAWKYADYVYHYAVRQVDRLYLWIGTVALDLWRRVIRDVWTPLFRSLDNVWRWLHHEGAILWYYITHPDKLVDLLWRDLLVKIEAESWTAGRLLGDFFLSLIIHNLRRFALLLEDILMAVL